MAKFQLSIPEPCSEKWEEMKTTSCGAFCNSCQKEVVDFTRMSDRQIISFFSEPVTGHICGRFLDEQLAQSYSKTTTTPFWNKWLIAVMVGIGVPGLAFGQETKEVAPQKITTNFRQTLPKIERLKPGEHLIEKLKGGVYSAETGEPLPGVVVSFGNKALAVTDERGDFILL